MAKTAPAPSPSAIAAAFSQAAPLGDLVRVPIITARTLNTTSGSALLAVNTGNWAFNPADGSLSDIAMTVPGTIGSGAQIVGTFVGRVFGLAWLRTAGQAVMPEVVIDGRAYRFGGEFVPQNLGTVLGTSDVYASWIVDDQLPNDSHKFSICLPPDPNGASRSVKLHSLIVEKRAGYVDPPQRQAPAVGAVPTSNTAVARALATGSLNSLRKIDYVNTSGAAIIVTVKWNGSTIWSKSIAAGDTQTFDPGDNTAWDGATTTFAHSAAATGVVFAAYGRG